MRYKWWQIRFIKPDEETHFLWKKKKKNTPEHSALEATRLRRDKKHRSQRHLKNLMQMESLYRETELGCSFFFFFSFLFVQVCRNLRSQRFARPRRIMHRLVATHRAPCVNLEQDVVSPNRKRGRPYDE